MKPRFTGEDGTAETQAERRVTPSALGRRPAGRRSETARSLGPRRPRAQRATRQPHLLSAEVAFTTDVLVTRFLEEK